MAAPYGGKLNSEQIIEDFKFKIGKLVENVSHNPSDTLYRAHGSSGFVNYTPYTLSSNSLDNSTPFPPSEMDPAAIGAPGTIPSAATLISTIKDLLSSYAVYQKLNFHNNSSGGIGRINISITSKVRTSASWLPALQSAIKSDVDAKATTHGIVAGQPYDADKTNLFINECQEIWTNRCNSTPLHTFNYSYCHSNHSNHANHGSRSRR